MSIVVTCDDAGRASAFLDGLRKGPRLLGVVSVVTVTPDAEGACDVQITVSGLLFVDRG